MLALRGSCNAPRETPGVGHAEAAALAYRDSDPGHADENGGECKRSCRCWRPVQDSGGVSAITVRTRRLGAATGPRVARAPHGALRFQATRTAEVLSGHIDALIEPAGELDSFAEVAEQRPVRPPGAVRPDPALAAYLAPLPGSWAAWILPGANGACVDAVSPSAGVADVACGAVRVALAGELIVRYAAGSRLLGLAPNAIQTIDVQARQGAVRAAVSNNSWSAAVTVEGAASLIMSHAGATPSYRVDR